LVVVDWFRKADEYKKLKVQLSKLEQRQQNDAKALTLILPQITEDEDSWAEREIIEIVKQASRVVRRELSQWASKESKASFEADREPKFHLVIPILKGLIAADPDGKFFEYRGELSFALSRKRPPDLAEAEKYISEAIELRDRNQHTGWRY